MAANERVHRDGHPGTGDGTATSVSRPPHDVRRADDRELDEILQVCASALAWDPAEPNATFFRWKHLDNPFGPSPMWVTADDGRLVGVRAMMRWSLRHGSGRSLSVVRAVDTATAPSHQGRGIFSRLTQVAVDELAREGVDAIFNTPNDKSRPGYLKLGWQQVGRLPVGVRPRTPTALLAMARSRTAAEKWGRPTTVGLEPAVALADEDALARLLTTAPTPAGWSTPLSGAYLRWRTGFEPLQCRILPLGATVADGLLAFRLRRRGELLQLSLLEAAAPPARQRALRRAIRSLLADTGADVAMVTGATAGPRSLVVPLPRAGPTLTWRPLATPDLPALSDLALPLGAVELF